MATANLSEYNTEQIPSGQEMRIGIVYSEWNGEITDGLKQGAIKTLVDQGVVEANIVIHEVPGSFELPLGAQFLMEYADIDAVICLGCVIQGETKHFDFVCHGVTQGIVDVQLKYNKPVIFGVLTDHTFEQSRARSGGELGNKGVEAAVSALKMVALQRLFSK